jgi:hypothetical protein
MKELLKAVTVYLICYFIFTAICGIVKTEMILSYVDKNVLSITRLSSYVAVITSILAVIIYFIAVTGASYFILWLFDSKPEYEVYREAVKWFILFYGLNELIKTIMLISFFKIESNYVINSVGSVENLLEMNKWYVKSSIVDFITFFLSLLSYAFVLLKKSKQVKILDVSIVILFLIIIFVIMHRDFLINILIYIRT